MFKATIKSSETRNIMPMGNMKLFDIGVVMEGIRAGHIVTRVPTGVDNKFLVVNLSFLGEGKVWTGLLPGNGYNVEIVPPGTIIEIEAI